MDGFPQRSTQTNENSPATPHSVTSEPFLASYNDYRMYLSDWIEHRKTQQRGFSLRWLNARCQFSSPSYIQAILMRRRALTIEGASQVSAALKHSEFESDFFRLLVVNNNTRDEKERTQTQQDLDYLRKISCVKEIGRECRAFLSRWENIAIYCFLSDRTEAIGFNRIVKKFEKRMTRETVKETLRVLVYIGFAQFEEDSLGERFYSCSNDCILANKKISKADLNTFHKQILDCAAYMMNEAREKEMSQTALVHGASASDDLTTEFNGTTIRTSADRICEMRHYLAEVRSQFLARFYDATGDDVFHLETMLLPLTQSLSTREESTPE